MRDDEGEEEPPKHREPSPRFRVEPQEPSPHVPERERGKRTRDYHGGSYGHLGRRRKLAPPFPVPIAIKSIARRRRITAVQIAEALNVTPETVRQNLNGKHDISSATARLYLGLIGATFCDLERVHRCSTRRIKALKPLPQWRTATYDGSDTEGTGE